MTDVRTTSITDDVRVATYAIEKLRKLFPDWESLNRREQLDVLESSEPESKISTHHL